MSDLQRAIEDAIMFHELQLMSMQDGIDKGFAPSATRWYRDAKGYTEAALTALREKQQRESGCVYCNGETPIADTMDSLQRGSMLIVGGKRLVVDMPTDYISEEICYCPMCGKRLEVWHDAD